MASRDAVIKIYNSKMIRNCFLKIVFMTLCNELELVKILSLFAEKKSFEVEISVVGRYISILLFSSLICHFPLQELSLPRCQQDDQ